MWSSPCRSIPQIIALDVEEMCVQGVRPKYSPHPVPCENRYIKNDIKANDNIYADSDAYKNSEADPNKARRSVSFGANEVFKIDSTEVPVSKQYKNGKLTAKDILVYGSGLGLRGSPPKDHGWVRDGARRTTAHGWLHGNGTSKGDTNNKMTTPQRQTLDKDTYQWQTWSALQDDEASEVQNTSPQAMYKITKSEFRRLQAQVRSVQGDITGDRYRPNSHGFKKINQKEGETIPVLYRSQLASSLKAFKKKTWSPLEGTEKLDDDGYYRCRPHNVETSGFVPNTVHREHTHKPRPKTACAQYVPIGERALSSRETLARTRPHSAIPQPMTQTNESLKRGEYDTLSPKIVYELADEDDETLNKSMCLYGDKNHFTSQSLKSSGRDSDYDSGLSRISASDMSDNENDEEPPIIKNSNIPDLKLRPEILDSFCLAQGLKDPRKFDFDAMRLEIPPYEFTSALPIELNRLDYREISQIEFDWRDQTKLRPPIKEDEKIIDRIVLLEKLQVETEEWERARRERIRNAIKQKRSDYKLSKGVRPISTKPKDRKCCPRCVQLSCVGDCPVKRATSNQCVHCFQKYCDGKCVNTNYEFHSRAEGTEEDAKSSRKPRPSSCNSCKRSNSNAKRINANRVILGRPKSGHATYSTGQRSVPSTKDLRPRPNTPIHADIEKELEKLDLDPNRGGTSRPNTAKSSVSNTGSKRPSGRALVVPHKSYFSQRRHSLTDLTKLEKAGQNGKKKRLKSAKKRPKTANAKCT
ncbi:unnamed protein product [Owenia fusiformis]|uniref:Uncharacterized protein n=1 Tax=Owenia fusiformis TaxID=6347 RepID=A0A8J1TUV4_OWEFU|nr:unnamed protein product [Owenia fusiformis]